MRNIRSTQQVISPEQRHLIFFSHLSFFISSQSLALSDNSQTLLEQTVPVLGTLVNTDNNSTIAWSKLNSIASQNLPNSSAYAGLHMMNNAATQGEMLSNTFQNKSSTFGFESRNILV